MRPALHYPPLIYYINHVGLLDCAQAMRHCNRGAPACRSVQGCLDNFL